MQIGTWIAICFFCVQVSVVRTQTEYHDKFRTYLQDVLEGLSESAPYVGTPIHDKRIRPVTDQANAVDVSVEFQIISLSKLDTFSKSMDFAGRLVLKWNNQAAVVPTKQRNWLEFNARLIDQDSVWTPDIALYNSMGDRERLGHHSYRIQIDMDGNCEWLVGVVATTSCTFDVTVFPFDKPVCTIAFTTWKHYASEVLLTSVDENANLTWYVDHSEWIVENTTATTNIQNGVSYLNYTIYFKREAGFVLVNMILPVILVSLLNSLAFLVPHESGERITYAVFLFLWFAVYLEIISMNLPVSSENMSNLSMFVIYMVALSILTVFLDVLSIMLFNRDERKQVPWCIESFVRFLRCRCGGSNRSRVIGFEDVESYDVNGPKQPTTVALGTKVNNKVTLLLRDFEVPNEDLKKTQDIYHEPRRRKSDEIDWKIVAITFDYIFFVFILFFTLGLCVYFLVPLVSSNAS